MADEARAARRRSKRAARLYGEDGAAGDGALYPAGWETASPNTRLAPAFIIIGTQRGGTTSLFRTLEGHPAIGSPVRKEIHFFDRFHQLGFNYYLSYFPELGSAQLTGEATPYYLYDRRVPSRVRAALPAVKLIAILRNPVSRAYSHYQMMVRRGVETLSFEDAIAAEDDRLAAAPNPESDAQRYHSYLHRGYYAEQLTRWYEHFPRSQLLVVPSEAFYQEPATTLCQIEDWLGLERWASPDSKAYNSRQYETMSPATRDRLATHFDPYNQQLSALLDRDLGW